MTRCCVKAPRLAILLLVVLLGALVPMPGHAFSAICRSSSSSSSSRSRSSGNNSSGSSSSCCFCVAQRPRKHSLALSSNRDSNDSESTGERDSSSSRRNNSNSRNRLGLKRSMEPGDTVVAKRDIATLQIYENASYELVSVYAQRFVKETQQMEKVALSSLDENEIPAGYDRYVTLYSSKYHTDGGKGPVVVTPEEAGLVSVRHEIVGALWLAVPGLFWIFVATSFANYYHTRTGGDFFDAFWGR